MSDGIVILALIVCGIVSYAWILWHLVTTVGRR